MKLKLRPKLALRTVAKGDAATLQTAYAIEVYVDCRWTLLGDDDGPMYFKTPEERNKKMASLQGAEVVKG